jgi:hypothetical protein
MQTSEKEDRLMVCLFSVRHIVFYFLSDLHLSQRRDLLVIVTASLVLRPEQVKRHRQAVLLRDTS